MRKDFGRLAARYGRAVCLRENGVDALGKAFLQPLRDKEERLLPTPLGRRERGRFLYLGEPGLALDGAGEDALVLCGEDAYRIVTARAVYFGADILFRWAILELEEGSA